MAIGDIIVGIDIGTSKVSLVVGEVNNFNQIEIICSTSHKCSAIKKEESCEGCEELKNYFEKMQDYVLLAGIKINRKNKIL